MINVTMERSHAAERSFRTGRGNWHAFEGSVDTILRAAQSWGNALKDVERPWLCWNVDSDWSLVQQRLVEGTGWTPIVGFDPRVGAPPIIRNAILVDFNAELSLPVLYPHFILEFVFAFADKLAFWHSDLLLTEHDMAVYAKLFSKLKNGELAAVPSPSGWRNLVAGSKRRYWELIGCTTRKASQSQFDHGCGWWMNFYHHPNFADEISDSLHWEYGCGIEYWRRKFGGRVFHISEKKVAYGHFTRIGNASYVVEEKNNIFRELGKDLGRNYRIKDCVQKLQLSHLLQNHELS